MIDTPTARSAHPTNPASTHSGTFEPAAWLARYTALGGCYTRTDTALNLCVVVNGQTCPELIEARDMADRLSAEERAALFHHLSGAPSPTWRDVVARYNADKAALVAHPYGRTAPDDPAYPVLSHEADTLTEASEASLRRLFETPAPDHVALRLKLETAAAEYFDDHGIMQHLIADVDRLTPSVGDDSAILDAWEQRSAAYRRYNALPYSESQQVGDMTPAERAEWAIIDAAEAAIRASLATTPEGAAIQLWIGLQHTLTKRDEEAACLRRDLAWFDAKDEELNWSARLIVAALRSLKSQEA